MDSILILVLVLVSLGITAASIFGAKKMISGMLTPLLAQQAETKRLLAVGIPCAARVLHLDQTGTSVAVMGEQSYELRFHLEVTPPAAAAYRGGRVPRRSGAVPRRDGVSRADARALAGATRLRHHRALRPARPAQDGLRVGQSARPGARDARRLWRPDAGGRLCGPGADGWSWCSGPEPWTVRATPRTGNARRTPTRSWRPRPWASRRPRPWASWRPGGLERALSSRLGRASFHRRTLMDDTEDS